MYCDTVLTIILVLNFEYVMLKTALLYQLIGEFVSGINNIYIFII